MAVAAAATEVIVVVAVSGGGGVFFPRVRSFWENVRQFIPHLRGDFFFFFLVEIARARAHYFHSFRPASVHSGSASWDGCDWVFPDKSRVSSFRDRFPHYA